MLNIFLVYKMILIAKKLIIKNNNLVHNINHSRRVALNCTLICNDLFSEDYYNLMLASFWHDAGRNDNVKEKIPHEIISKKLFVNMAIKHNLSSSMIKKVSNIILNHRNRGNTTKNYKNYVEMVFWDADKLDIFNINRIKKIKKLYKKNIEFGEYNEKDSQCFWRNINEDFEEKFFTNKAKIIFSKKFTKFRRLIN